MTQLVLKFFLQNLEAYFSLDITRTDADAIIELMTVNGISKYRYRSWARPG